MSEFRVLEVGFFIRPDDDGKMPPEAIHPSYEYRIWGRVTVEMAGVGDVGDYWKQQGVLEGQMGWGLYDWTLVSSRSVVVPGDGSFEDVWGEWDADVDEDGPSRPLTGQDRRNLVALALHRARAHIAAIDTARI